MVPEDPIMRVFESTTSQWRSLANPPAMLEAGKDEGVGARVSIVMLQGLLYVLFKSYNNREYWLFLYNALEDVWVETRMHIPGRDTFEDILVVSGNYRLFLESSCSDVNWPLAIHELLVGKRECKVVFQMQRALVGEVFNVQEIQDLDRVLQIQAFGFGSSIVLASSGTGCSVVVDSETGLWDALPANPVKVLFHFEFKFFGGKPMKQLRLPSSIF